MKKKLKRTNWPRILIQWSVIAVVICLLLRHYLFRNLTADFEAYCPFGGIQALGSYLLNQALSCTMTTAQIVMGVLLFAAVLVFSKLFCSFICPLGTVGEWLGKLGSRFRVRFTIRGFADHALRIIKYGLLFVTFYYTLQSNELFCKKFDPYYAAVSGFDTDVVVWYAVTAIVLLILGSVFVRLFWCKYLCPLSALSNIFKFAGFFIVVMAAYLVALAAGATISYVWPLAVLCIGGFLIEVTRLRSTFVPVVKITRNTDSCTDCGLCARKCPQAIDVDKVKVVHHVDCNLCGDCLLACPVKNTLQVNRRNSLKWISPIATVILVAAGISLGTLWELPTIDQRWYDEETMEQAAVYQQAGLKNIKCFGSSSAFANQMKRVEGVLGVATYVKNHRVKIYYDPGKLDPVKIQEAIFTPAKGPVRPLAKGVDSVTVVTLALENFFDPYDFNYLTRLLQQQTPAVGLITEFGCPPVVKICFPSDSLPAAEELTRILETKKLTLEAADTKTTVDLGYEVVTGLTHEKIGRTEYIHLLFKPFAQDFNDRDSFTGEVLSTYEIPMGSNGGLRNRFSYLVSHLSNDSGIVEFRTLLDSADREVAHILFVDTLTDGAGIFRALTADSLKITYTNGESALVKSMFRFGEEGRVLEKEK